MSKRPTPKRKVAKGKSSVRYKAFVRGVQRRLREEAPLVPCQQCKQPILNHHACPNCGTYRGKPVVSKEKQVQKITKIKA